MGDDYLFYLFKNNNKSFKSLKDLSTPSRNRNLL